MKIQKDYTRSIDNALGYYVGEYIINEYLPTLEINGITSKNVVSISEEDKKEYERIKRNLNIDSFTKDKYTPSDWNEYIRYRSYLSNKYMKHQLECYVPKFKISDIQVHNFKRGLMSSLWNSDMCGYKCEEDKDIVITEDTYYTIITLQLDLRMNLMDENGETKMTE